MRRTLAEQAEHARRGRDEVLAHDVERVARRLAEVALERTVYEMSVERFHFDALVRAYEERW